MCGDGCVSATQRAESVYVCQVCVCVGGRGGMYWVLSKASYRVPARVRLYYPTAVDTYLGRWVDQVLFNLQPCSARTS